MYHNSILCVTNLFTYYYRFSIKINLVKGVTLDVIQNEIDNIDPTEEVGKTYVSITHT